MPRYFYHTNFDLNKDFYMHSEIVDSVSVDFSDLIITNYYNLDNEIKIYFDENYNIKFDDIEDTLGKVSMSESGSNLKFDYFPNNNNNIDNIFIKHSKKQKIPIGSSMDNKPLLIEHDNRYFKTSKQLILSHPKIQIKPIDLSWPKDQLKTGKICHTMVFWR